MRGVTTKKAQSVYPNSPFFISPAFQADLDFAGNTTNRGFALSHNANSGTSAQNVANHIQQGSVLDRPAGATLPTPIKWQILRLMLSGYQEEAKHFLVAGFRDGFYLQFRGEIDHTVPGNHRSALQNVQVVEALLTSELNLGRIQGPFDSCPLVDLKISPLGLVPKKEVGKFRLIHDLSWPKGSSVNDGIPHEEATVSYETFDDVVRLILDSGPFSMVAKCDILEAFRIIPINPIDYHLLGFMWNDKIFFDMCLAMGCSSSCRIFESFSNALQWILCKAIPSARVSHILDDFVFVGPHNSSACLSLLNTFLAICERLGVPINHNKTVLPCTSITVYGLIIDTAIMEIQLPVDKINKLIETLNQFLRKKNTLLSNCKVLQAC